MLAGRSQDHRVRQTFQHKGVGRFERLTFRQPRHGIRVRGADADALPGDQGGGGDRHQSCGGGAWTSRRATGGRQDTERQHPTAPRQQRGEHGSGREPAWRVKDRHGRVGRLPHGLMTVPNTFR